MELAALRQCLWRKPGEGYADPRFFEAKIKEATDYCVWIDTRVMVADPLTKRMNPWLLLKVLSENRWSWAQPESAKAEKAKKQEQRRSKRNDAKLTDGDDNSDPECIHQETGS